MIAMFLAHPTPFTLCFIVFAILIGMGLAGLAEHLSDVDWGDDE